MLNSHKNALVLFSGGQDSATCLIWALKYFNQVETIGFNYGQRHLIELEIRKKFLKEVKYNYPEWNEKLGKDHLISMNFIKDIADTAMIQEFDVKIEAKSGLPSTFVPGRNLLFLLAAASLGYKRDINILVIGACETDFSGYPDCRNITIKAQELAINLGLNKKIEIKTPLMDMDKAQLWDFAVELGGIKLLDMIVNHTHTCYLGDRTILYKWGYGCGKCFACELRKKGWIEWNSRKN